MAQDIGFIGHFTARARQGKFVRRALPVRELAPEKLRALLSPELPGHLKQYDGEVES